MLDTRLTDHQLSGISPWKIAEHYGIGYSGDGNPVNHGGFFYSLDEWEEHGVTQVVEFWEDPETGNLVVQIGCMIKPKDMTGAFEASDIPPVAAIRQNVHLQIQCVRYHHGIEPHGTGFPALKSFNLKTWKEHRIWRSIRGWLEQLGCK